jgi:RNA polymerase sigma-70 factor (ECF subfamily)
LEPEEWERLRSSDEALTDHVQLEQMRKAIAELPLPYREVFTLFYLEEKTYEEMMDILKKPKGTIASLLSRAKKLLQEQLSHTSL